MFTIEDIKLYCKARKAIYISHVDNNDSTITIKAEIEHRVDYRSMDSLIEQQKLIESNETKF